MPDMLVPLYALPFDRVDPPAGIDIRPALAPETHLVTGFARRLFSEGWASECATGMAAVPATVMIAVEHGRLAGFACHDVTARGFFGPTGVDPEFRGRGVGTALLRASLLAMRQAGYGYAVIGGAGPVDFYAAQCGAIEIPGSGEGIYKGMLK